MVDDRTVWNLDRKNDISPDLLFAISMVQGAKINSRLFKVFKEL